MGIDKEKIKDAFNDFENDDFIKSREVLSKELNKGVNTFLKDKLKLKNNPLTIDDEEE